MSYLHLQFNKDDNGRILTCRAQNPLIQASSATLILIAYQYAKNFKMELKEVKFSYLLRSVPLSFLEQLLLQILTVVLQMWNESQVRTKKEGRGRNKQVCRTDALHLENNCTSFLTISFMSNNLWGWTIWTGAARVYIERLKFEDVINLNLVAGWPPPPSSNLSRHFILIPVIQYPRPNLSSWMGDVLL